jgi:hypothetical protein
MFWTHLNSKGPADRRRRIAYLAAAFDLIRNSMVRPVLSDEHDGRKGEYYRFQGMTKTGEKFAVQILKDKKNNRYFMSCFPMRK